MTSILYRFFKMHFIKLKMRLLNFIHYIISFIDTFLYCFLILFIIIIINKKK